MSRRQKKQKRWDGIIGIGDRVAFYMPGEQWITAGEVMDITIDQQTLTIGNLACTDTASSRRVTTLPSVGGKPVNSVSALTMQVQRGLVVENKTEVRRLEARERRKNKGKRGKYTPDRRPQEPS